eukprot:7375990-Prymnesium_polylepis.1
MLRASRRHATQPLENSFRPRDRARAIRQRGAKRSPAPTGAHLRRDVKLFRRVARHMEEARLREAARSPRLGRLERLKLLRQCGGEHRHDDRHATRGATGEALWMCATRARERGCSGGGADLAAEAQRSQVHLVLAATERTQPERLGRALEAQRLVPLGDPPQRRRHVGRRVGREVAKPRRLREGAH